MDLGKIEVFAIIFENIWWDKKKVFWYNTNYSNYLVINGINNGNIYS